MPQHDAPLFATIVVGFVLAFCFGFLARRLKLPPLVGYLVAGVAVGPFTPGFVADIELASQLAEIGVVLLMFGVGVHFSLRDLMAVRWIALTGALVQIIASVAACLGLAALWGWPLQAGALLGLALSVASTVVLLRVLEDRRSLDSEAGRIAVGWLIVQDVAMVLALVLLPALAPALGGDPRGLAGHVAGDDLVLTLAITLAKLALFMALVLVVGMRVVPWLLVQVARTGSRELFTLSVLALALGIAYGSAELFGVSLALGAFFAGVVLSESDLSHQAAADSLPLQDAFAVLFFVSVGMLFDPAVMAESPLRVIEVLAVVVAVKSLPALALLLAAGQSLPTALTVTAGLAQIGEFSFIVAGLGVALGLLPAEGRDLILAGALLSIMLNPLLFAALGPAARWFEARPALSARLERPRGGALALLSTAAEDGRQGGLRDHAVLVGFGRVGGAIARALAAWDLPYVVVERDRWRVEELRTRPDAPPVVFGDACAHGILSAAGVERARLLIVATPDGYQARRILQIARAARPGIDTLVRTHSEEELHFLESQNVGLAILSEQELALGMMGYALRSMGLSQGEANLYVQSSRRSDDAVPEILEPAPELRPHREPEDADGTEPAGASPA